MRAQRNASGPPSASLLHLFAQSRQRYMGVMRTSIRNRLAPAATIALTALALAAATGVAFSAWLEKGAAIFMTYAEAGLAWCF